MNIVESWELAREIREGTHDESKPDAVVVQAWVTRLSSWAQESILRQTIVCLLQSGIPPDQLRQKFGFWVEKALDPNSMLR